MKAKIFVRLKSGVLDPQGLAVSKSLQSLGYDGIESVRQGKMFEVEVNTTDKAKAEQMLKEAAAKLLANTVIEDFEISLS